jgi:type II secretory pathway pseudopilin PulG
MEDETGFSLIETLFAIAVLVAGVCALAQLSVLAAQTNRRAEALTVATALAEEKIAQLSALAWTRTDSGLPISDVSTDTAQVPEPAAGGTGLTIGGDLGRDVEGYADSRFSVVRRWTVESLPDEPDARVLTVLVADARGIELARLIAVRTRRSR